MRKFSEKRTRKHWRGMTTSGLIALAIPLLGVLVMGLGAQEATDPPTQPLQHSLSGREMPRYHLVGQFFTMALGPCGAGTEANCRDFLTDVGLDPKSAASDALRRAMSRFVELEFGPEGLERMGPGGERGTVLVGRPSEGGSGGQTEMVGQVSVDELEKARGLGRIYGELEQALLANGSSLDVIDQYIDRAIAPNTVIHSDLRMDSGHRIWTLDAAFQESLGRVEGGQK